MNKIVCSKCGNSYEDFFDDCPYCKSQSIELKENKIEESSSSIIFDSCNEEELQKKEEIINKRNQSIKKINKKVNNNNKLFSYLMLVMGMILLFIIIFSSILGFVLIPFVHYILTILLLFLSFSLTNQNIEIGYFTATVASLSMILMIYERDYISAIIGIYIFISSFKYLLKK